MKLGKPSGIIYHVLLSFLILLLATHTCFSITVTRPKNRIIVKNGLLIVSFYTEGKKACGLHSIVYNKKEYLNLNKSGGIRSFGLFLKDGKPIQKEMDGKSIRHKWLHKINKKKSYTEILFWEKGSPKWPMNTEIGWLFKEDDPGFYYYLNYHHDKNDQNIQLQQTRMSFLVTRNIFQKAYIEPNRIYNVTPFSQWENYKMIMDATYLLKNGEIITKYSWSTRKENQRFYGYTGNKIGIFHLFPSMEHVNGGPNKQSNTEHHTPDGPTILNVMSSSHYGAGPTDIKGEWNKLYGPFYVLLTDKQDWKQNIAEAETKQQELEKEWPFKWFEHKNHVIQRGTMQGRIKINGQFAVNALVMLTTEKATNMSATLNHGRGYMFWARTDKKGQFFIPNIRPNKYYIHVHQAGIWEDFHTPLSKPYHVKAGIVLDIKELKFNEKEKNELLWQIGIPDRNSTEFRGAQNDEFRPFLGTLKLKETFKGDNPLYIIGKSDPIKDFYYAHPVFLANIKEFINMRLDVKNSDHSSFEIAPVRNIEFSLGHKPKGPYRLTLAFANAKKTRLEIKLNNKVISKLKLPFDVSAGFRNGSYGLPCQRSINIKAKLLNENKNILSIRHMETLSVNTSPPPKKKNTERKHDIILEERPDENRARLISGSFGSCVLYDAIKLERVSQN